MCISAYKYILRINQDKTKLLKKIPFTCKSVKLVFKVAQF
jgi:hypothetical protein